MTIAIREAAAGDESLLLEFIRALARYERLAEKVVATKADIAHALFCSQPKVFGLIAEIEREPCGFALYFFNFSTFLGRHGVYLEDLFVREEHRGRGVGRALLSRLARIAVEHGCGRLEWSVLDWNASSIAFYRSLGAEAMDEWTVYRMADRALEKLAADG
jgi:GNAT superfamily N-acetyltransferase